ncbi:TraX family protein [Gardnerella sp. 2492-Sm]|uniref:TraX family protein n=1 Tax=unclassified Gardnerella TaxID=2628112 RepID=UPI003D058ACD
MSINSDKAIMHDSENTNKEMLDANGKPIRADRNIKTGITLNKLKMLGAFMLMLGAFSNTVIARMFGETVTDNMLALTIILVCEFISWTAVPWYAWILVRGYHNTHNLNLYMLRLFILAVICEVPYDLVNSKCFFDMRSQNPVFAMVIALFVLSSIDTIRERFSGFSKGFAITIVVIAGLLWNLLGKVFVQHGIFFGGITLLIFVLLFEFLKKREITMEMTAGMFGAVSMLGPGIGVAVLHYRSPYGDGVKPTKQFRWIMYVWYPMILLLGSIFAFI